MKRREILKTLTMFPLAGAIGNSGSIVQAAPLPKRDIFSEFGLRTFINASGYFTSLSGSLMNDEAFEAIRDASKHFCRLEEVQDKVGARIASLLHAESAMVTAGAFSALMLGMAGILSGIFHAPLTAIFLIAEITGGYDLMIPLMIVSAFSYTVSKYF